MTLLPLIGSVVVGSSYSVPITTRGTTCFLMLMQKLGTTDMCFKHSYFVVVEFSLYICIFVLQSVLVCLWTVQESPKINVVFEY